MSLEDDLGKQLEEEVIVMVAELYDLYLGENHDTPKVTTHDLASWGYSNHKISMQDWMAIRNMPNVMLP